jgi:hypothetical protein
VSVGAWEGTCEDGVRLSDHNGICIDLIYEDAQTVSCRLDQARCLG